MVIEITELFDQNPWWKDKEKIEEDYDIIKWKSKKHRWIPDIKDKISLKPFALHIITGPRQAGKTTLFKLMIKELIEKREPKSIFYFNCENVSDHKELTEILKLYLEFKEDNKIKNSLIFLDEITSPLEWYKTLKFFIDKGDFKDDVLLVTGSSSISVKKHVELFPGRRGNGKDFIIYPLSFRGFIKIIEPDLIKKIPIITNLEEINRRVTNALLYEKELNNYLKKYMGYGGFPLSIANLNQPKEEAKNIYLSWIKNAILKSDRSDLIARQIIKILVETQQSDISWENISKKIEIKSPKTVASYIELLNSIFVINILYNIDISGKSIKFGKNKKIHFKDPLLFDIFEEWALTETRNKYSAIAESLVAEHLCRAFPGKVFFWKNKQEIDAVVLEKNRIYGFEVKWKEKSEKIKYPNQFKEIYLITKKEFSKKPLKIPLSVFLVMIDV